jgi:hypothetical protein
MKMFLSFNQFLPRHAPFVERKYGVAWFTEDFPAFNPDNEEEVNEVWRAYLEQTVLSCMIRDKSNQFGLVGYLPNYVSRQFGMSQMRPKTSFYCTDGFCAWWDDYYFSHSIGNVEQMLGMVESGFILPALGKKPAISGRGTKILVNFLCNFYCTYICVTD